VSPPLDTVTVPLAVAAKALLVSAMAVNAVTSAWIAVRLTLIGLTSL